MMFLPKPLGTAVLSAEELKADRAARVKYGPCALGKKALYVGSYFLSSRYYIPLAAAERVYKRLAVSKGFYEGRVFGSLAYLVVRYGQGREKVCRFDHEEELDALLNAVRRQTDIPVGKP